MKVRKCELCEYEWDEAIDGRAYILHGLKVCESCHDNWPCGEPNTEVVQEILKGAAFGDKQLRKQLATLHAKFEKLEAELKCAKEAIFAKFKRHKWIQRYESELREKGE